MKMIHTPFGTFTEIHFRALVGEVIRERPDLARQLAVLCAQVPERAAYLRSTLSEADRLQFDTMIAAGLAQQGDN